MINKTWEHFAEQFGVANLVPIALASDTATSTLPGGVIGKVPSIYNTRGEIVGFHDWQKCRAKKSDIEKWAKDARYGFGVILGQPLPGGGVAVCIDCDTENTQWQETIHALICAALNTTLVPMRVRTNSKRRAYVLCIETADKISKRILKLSNPEAGKKGEAIEILGQGQQFAAYGRHPSGADIEWLDHPADSLTADELLPVMGQGGDRLSLEQFEALIAAIGEALPVLTDTSKRARNRSEKGAAVKPDEVALFLDANGWTLSIGPEGERHIRSPFEENYTTAQGDNDTSVTYFLPGTRDYESGHFVSHHASDAALSDADFLNQIGFIASQFEAHPPSAIEQTASRPRLTQIKGGKLHDRVEATLLNCLAALSAPSWLGHDVAYDQFTGSIVIGGPGNWRAFQDVDYITLRVELESKGFVPVGRDLIRDAVHQHAQSRQLDTALQWITSLKWDGVKRVRTFLHDYMGTANDEYTRALSMYMWTALAGRCLVPGIKADMMPVLVGDQGCGKSTGVEALAPDLKWFVEMSFHDTDADQARKMRGALVAEFAEMNGLRSRAIEAIKAMVTRTTDKWIEKYQTHKTEFLRRCLFIGTSNDDELLYDATGNRRWLPVTVGKVDVERIREDRNQLWAEAATLFKKYGIAYEAVTMAVNNAGIHEQYRATDPAEDLIRDWLNAANDLSGGKPLDKGYVTTAEVMQDIGPALGVRYDRSGQMRVGNALRALNFRKVRKVVNNSLISVYVEAPKKVCFTHLAG